MKLEQLTRLEARNRTLLIEIANAEQLQDKSVYPLKKELYENKIKMIEIITVEETRAGITARELKRLVELRPKVPRYETGIEALDYKLHGGIEIGTFVQLAGESGVGKTHLLLEILSNIANYSSSVFFNFEMGDTRIIKRLDRLLIRDVQWDNLIIDGDSRNLDTLCNEITLYARSGYKFFTDDSKMKIEVSGNQEDHQKYSSITNRLAKLCQQLDIIIFLVNQMSEQDIKNKRLAYKGSGDQKYDTDISLFYVKDENGQRKLICDKNRQDEELFALELFLNEQGKTVSNETPTTYQANDGRYTAKPTVTEYVADNNLQMAVI